MENFKAAVWRYLFPVSVLVLFGLMFWFTASSLLRHSRTFDDELIVSDIAQLSNLFAKIDEQCKIISFDHQQNYIDFLTVEKFVSSEIGSMNLTYPEKWEGPYVKDNPTLQGEVFRVIKTRKGYYIVPGKNIQLSNGVVLDRDLVFDENADIDAMIIDHNKLRYRNKALATKITTSGGKVPSKVDVHLSTDTSA